MDDVLTDFRAAIDALFARTTNNTKLGLERTELLLDRMGAPHRQLTAIHVAGTNGKGSVVASCEAMLRATGQRIGRYTSPHLIDFRERITIDGSPINEGDVLAFLEKWTPFAEETGATFFELTTAMAFDYFAREKVDVAVIETGLGGRLDSTNVLDPIVATVTSIGLDHTELLGDTLSAIAIEKAGIFKRNRPAVIGEHSSEIAHVLYTAARDRSAKPVISVDDAYAISQVQITNQGTSFLLEKDCHKTEITTPLVGEYQARNTAIAVATLDAAGENFKIAPDKISAALQDVFLPGRFQRIDNIIVDVAHNPAGARALAENLEAVKPAAPIVALVAVLADKDWRGIVEELSVAVDEFVFTVAPSAPLNRQWNPSDATTFTKKLGSDATTITDIDAALARAQRRAATLLVTGSFHTVGDVMSRLQVSPFAA